MCLVAGTAELGGDVAFVQASSKGWGTKKKSVKRLPVSEKALYNRERIYNFIVYSHLLSFLNWMGFFKVYSVCVAFVAMLVFFVN